MFPIWFPCRFLPFSLLPFCIFLFVISSIFAHFLSHLPSSQPKEACGCRALKIAFVISEALMPFSIVVTTKRTHTHSAECYTLRLLKGRDPINSMKYFVLTLVHELHKYRNNPDALEAAQETRSRQTTMINWRLTDSLIMNTSSLQCL